MNIKGIKKCILGLFFVLLTCSYAVGGISGPGQPGDVNGVIGLHPVENNSCFAIWMPIPENKALAGVLWYNNDGVSPFSEVLLESGTPEYPVTLQDCQLMASDVFGNTSDWSQLDFDGAIACTSEGLYLLFRLSEGDDFAGEGQGGGPALGYMVDGTGKTGWISADGEDWVPFKDDVGFAVLPVFVDASEATLIMQGAQQSGRRNGARVTALHAPSPNPFNPSTTLSFALAQDSRVELSIYNVRGELVKRLLDGEMAQGQHEVTWYGRDSVGNGVASGVYLARLEAGDVVMTQRMVLVQ